MINLIQLRGIRRKNVNENKFKKGESVSQELKKRGKGGEPFRWEAGKERYESVRQNRHRQKWLSASGEKKSSSSGKAPEEKRI